MRRRQEEQKRVAEEARLAAQAEIERVRLEEEARLAPADDASARHPQRRNNLFRVVQRRLIDRGAVSAVAMTQDSAKRVRQARRDLLAEGILILGPNDNQRRVSAALGLPQPGPGQWISVSVTHRRPDEAEGPFAEIKGEQWRVTTPGDPDEAVPAVL
ncbi:NaeI family type II restriction endonuclease [Streptomyces sp. NPDC016459]|uniref:NaeI family type II restriction endonuclease n=1 Tax=Streptomyces sp. NPDC016459 TaxID=3157190 RepID=UPI0033D2775D